MELQKHQAIQATLEGNWELAITINEDLLKGNPGDIETLNRLAFAYTIVGKITHAKDAYKKVLEIDIFNPIAIKNLKRLGTGTSTANGTPQLVVNMFLEESGKTKIINLINTAPPKVIQSLQVGQKVVLCIKRLKIFVLDENKQYIGMLPDNISTRLIKFLNGGNQYEVYIKSIETHSVSIFIREKKRSAKFKNQPTFGAGEMHSQLFKKESRR
ncbi:MAG TPA: hypothetical protein VLG12_02415 [Candidatus Saccharimonadales bacterium]|nr:hypothetical protein [Candidatus Saccharimonadales bacterium]